MGGDELEHCDSDVLACGSDHRLVLCHQSERTSGVDHHFHHRFCDRSECNDKREPRCDLRGDSRLLRRPCGLRFGRPSECQVSVETVKRKCWRLRELKSTVSIQFTFTRAKKKTNEMSERFSCPPLLHSSKSVNPQLRGPERRAFCSRHQALPSSPRKRKRRRRDDFNLPTLRSCPSYREVGPGRSYDLHRWV